MTIPELNGLPFLSLNIERIMRKLERGNPFPDFFLPFVGAEPEPPVMRIWRDELERLMPEYRRLTAYISAIPDPWTRSVFERRFILRQSFRDIGTESGILGQTLKAEVYSYLQRNPEGYVSCRDLAQAWGVGIDAVNHYCRMGRFPGAKKRKGAGSDGRLIWIIPADVQCPLSLQKRTPEGYVTDKELARALGVPPWRIQARCRQGLFPGAVKRPYPHGNHSRWIIPERFMPEKQGGDGTEPPAAAR